MIYAKQIINGKLTALLTYDYEVEFGEDSDTIAITEEEYNAILADMQAEQPSPDPDRISDREALAIITGEVDADETK
jgi:hypothetical protein